MDDLTCGALAKALIDEKREREILQSLHFTTYYAHHLVPTPTLSNQISLQYLIFLFRTLMARVSENECVCVAGEKSQNGQPD